MEYLEFANRLCDIVLRAERKELDRDTILSELLEEAEEYRELFYRMEEMMETEE